MLRRLKFAVRMARAQSYASRGDTLSAQRELVALFHSYGEESWSSKTPLIANLMFAELCERSGQAKDAYDICLVILDQVSDNRKSTVYNEEELKFVSFRCKWVLSRLSKFKDSLAMRRALSVGVSWSDIDSSKISKVLKRGFPTPPDIARAVDAFVAENRETGTSSN